MNKRESTGRHVFILDTNVLIHDPSAVFRFQEHDVYLPMVVLEELDASKKGVSEVARNVRQVSRTLDELIEGADRHQIERGIELPGPESGNAARGRLFFQTRDLPGALPQTLPGSRTDNNLLATAIALQNSRPDSKVILVSKDINLRIKAHVLGIRAEDYYSDQVLDDVNLLYSGMAEIPAAVWASGERREENGRVLYTLSDAGMGCHPNQCLYAEEHDEARATHNEYLEGLVRACGGGQATVEIARDYRTSDNTVWGITARNREQNFALNLLMDPDIDFVTLLGTAGTGKTLLTLAAGLTQTLEEKRYREIVMTRVTVPVGEDIGFLPGTEEEKMTPWMGALMDNLEVLTDSEVGGEWGRAAANDLLYNRIKIRSLNFMRGRTFLNRYIIIDEAQNLTAKQMKTLITRAGPGTKVVCIGNIGQIDTPYLTETTSGLTYVVDRFKDWPHGGHVTLLRGERSRLADYAAETL